MTLADLLNTLESADMLRIIKGGEEMFVGYLALFAPEVGHTNCKLYEQYKFDEVVKFRAVPEITHRKMERIEPHVTTTTGRNAGFQVSRIANETVLHNLFITGQ